MHSYLHEAMHRKVAELDEARRREPLEALQARVRAMPRPRNFFRALVEPDDAAPFRIIAEIKRRDGAGAALRAGFDAVDIARRYHRAGASALAYDSDPTAGGSLEEMAAVAAATPLPLLRKDLLIDAYQVWESRAAGADAVLLVAEALTEGQVLDFQILASELGMTTVLQVHDAWNLLRLIGHVGFPHAASCLVAIDNRDPATLEVDLSTSRRLAELVEGRRILVSESGIATAEDLRRLQRHGIRIAMVGASLLRQPDPGAALQGLLEGE
jgi:indole-3-glycerol phosphate synthase